MFNHLFFMPFLCGSIFVVASLIMLKFPPKNINHLYGYRTSKSMKNTENWRFAQKYSSYRMLESGFFLMLISFVFPYLKLTEAQAVLTAIILLVASIIYMLFKTEKALIKFENQNLNNVN